MSPSKLYNISNYREKIDEIDNKIHKLLTERMYLMHQVKLVKRQYIKTGSTIRAARGIEVINNACNSLFPLYKKQVVINIWRNLISISEYIEQAFEIISLNQECYWLAREFFGNYINNRIEGNTEQLINHLYKNDSHFGFLPFPAKESDNKWWTYLINSDINVFAIAPLYRDYQNSALVIGHVMLEPTKEHNFTLIATQYVERIDHKCKIIDVQKAKSQSAKDIYLVELDGFHEDFKDSFLIGTYSLIK